MPNDDILKLRGRLAEANRVIETLVMSINVDIEKLRSLADKYEPKEKLDTKTMLIVVGRLHELCSKYRTLVDQVAAIKEDLGE